MVFSLRAVPLVFFMVSTAIMAEQTAMTTAGQFWVDTMGRANYKVPIQIPPGTAGLAPAIAISYSSHNVNGMVGIGGAITGVSTIFRCPKTKAQDGQQSSMNFSGNDAFCLNGSRLVPVDGTVDGESYAEYRTERTDFTKVISYGSRHPCVRNADTGATSCGTDPGWFKAWTKDGQILEFGNTGDSRIAMQNLPLGRVWALNKMLDVSGNYYTISYTKDASDGDFYVRRIDYSGNSATGKPADNFIQFVYEARPDPVIVHTSLSKIETKLRLQRVATFAGAAPVREYRLAYAVSPQSARSVLKSVTECEMQGGTCMPPTSFDWEFQAAGLSTQRWETRAGAYSEAQQWFVADVDGDGKTDFINVSDDVNHTLSVDVHLSSGNGYTMQRWATQIGADRENVKLFAADLNGDGKADLLRLTRVGNSIYAESLLSTGHSFSAPAGSDWLTDSDAKRLWFVADIDGDGRQDIASVGTDSAPSHLGVAFSRDGATAGSVAFGALVGRDVPQGAAAEARHWFVADVNGDGRADFVCVRNDNGSATTDVFLSNGTTLTPAITWETRGGGFWSTQKWMLADVTGDGRPDLINVFAEDGLTTVDVHVNVGGGFRLNRWQTKTGAFVDTQKWLVADLNGDGRADLVSIRDDDGLATIDVQKSSGTAFQWQNWETRSGGYQDTQRWFVADSMGQASPHLVHVFNDNDSVSIDAHLSNRVGDRLTNIITGLGAVYVINYSPLTDGAVHAADADAIYPLMDVRWPLYVVSALTAPDWVVGTRITKYRYGGLKAELNGRGLLGFRWIQSNDLGSGVAVRTDYQLDWPYTGSVNQVTTSIVGGGNDGLLKRQRNTHGCVLLGAHAATSCKPVAGGVYFIYDSDNVSESWDGNGVELKTITRTTQYDNWGNPTLLRQSDAGGSVLQVSTNYLNDTDRWIIGRPTQRATASRTTVYQYDTATGLLLKEIVEPGNATLRAETAYAYDAFGNITTTTLSSPAATKTVGVTYDSRGRFPVATSNALGQRASMMIEGRYGNVTSMTDENGLSYSWQYDGFGRRRRVIRSDGAQNDWDYLYCVGVAEGTASCPPDAKYLIQQRALAADGTTANGPWIKHYFNLLDREIATETAIFSGTGGRE
ncbi:FG-GAP-like repeat-containing protein [Duganella sp. S19_KUP01_CR8]|uniref:FG-GAP-like repeat-containing protein n=1 Tax=Duganella sp. S19_KUP01_CR8 TaxID=3025502 RepID=UPI002FCD92C7